MVHILNKLYNWGRKKCKKPSAPNTHFPRIQEMTFAISFTASLIYLLLGAWMISYFKNKEFFNSFYFMFSTLATIGFGGETFEQSIPMYYFIPYFCVGYTLLVMVATSGKAITRRMLVMIISLFYRLATQHKQNRTDRLALFRVEDGRFDLRKKREKLQKDKLKKRREKHKNYLKAKPFLNSQFS